ncbi:DUF996 domain-containing protein [Thermococcus stetteri]|uniref:DUF996 domain-containing protein n=1 Tax=Thermococcus stetteri TaxID=49900 RepID=UPI0031585969
MASLVWFGTIFGSMISMNKSPEMGLGMMGTGGLVAALLMIAGMWFMKQSYDIISEETGVKTFHTVGLLYIVGAVLSIIVIGILLIVVAAILEIIAFFSLPDELEKPSEDAVVVA